MRLPSMLAPREDRSTGRAAPMAMPMVRGVGHGKGDDPCGGQGLKNAHRRRGALEHAGEDHPHQDAQQGLEKVVSRSRKAWLSRGGETEALMVCMPNMSTANPSKMSPRAASPGCGRTSAGGCPPPPPPR